MNHGSNNGVEEGAASLLSSVTAMVAKRKSEKSGGGKAGAGAPVTIDDIEGAEEDQIDVAASIADAQQAVRAEQLRRNQRHALKVHLLGSGALDEEDDMEIVDASGPNSSMLLYQQKAGMVGGGGSSVAAPPSASAAGRSSANGWDAYDNDDTNIGSPGSPGPSASVVASSSPTASIRRRGGGGDDDDDVDEYHQRHFTLQQLIGETPKSLAKNGGGGGRSGVGIVPKMREGAVEEEVTRAAQIADQRQKSIELSHIGDNDEIVRMQRRRPEFVDFETRDKKLRQDAEERRERKRQDQEAIRKKKLEESPYVYVPKMGEGHISAVSQLSPSQRLELLRSSHVTTDDIVDAAERAPVSSSSSVGRSNNNNYSSSSSSNNNNNNTTSMVGSSVLSAAAPSSLSSSSQSPSRMLTAREMIEEDERRRLALSKNAQSILEKCFQPAFEVRTNNLEKELKKGTAIQSDISASRRPDLATGMGSLAMTAGVGAASSPSSPQQRDRNSPEQQQQGNKNRNSPDQAVSDRWNHLH